MTPAPLTERDVKRYEYTFTIWDWNVAWTDFNLFTHVIDEISRLRFTKVELGVPWRSSELAPGEYDFTEVDQRLAYLQMNGLDCRFRVNVQDPPLWYRGDVLRLPDGQVFDKDYGVQLDHLAIPSFCDDHGLAAQLRWVEAVAAHYSGKRYEYTLGVGLHFELKFGGWNTYEGPAVAKFQQWLRGRYADLKRLNAAWGAHILDFSSISPPVPSANLEAGISAPPDLDQATIDWIRFREERLAHVIAQYYSALRRGDPTSEISAPLGECFRKDAAEFANQDIHGLTRGADNVVFSYDFFIHSPHELWKMDQMIRAYADISRLPIKVELDGVATGTYVRYGDEPMFEFALTALNAGAVGINVANYTQERRWAEDLSKFPFMARLGDHIAKLNSGRSAIGEPLPPDTLVYISKWTQYCFRGRDEWLHAAQFGFEKLVRDAGRRTRFVTDENLLSESLHGFEVLVVPFAAVIDSIVIPALNDLIGSTATVSDIRCGETIVNSSNSHEPFNDSFKGTSAGFRHVTDIDVSTARLEGIASTFTVKLLPPTAGTPTIEAITARDSESIAEGDGSFAVWLAGSPIRRVVLGFNPSAGFFDDQARWNTMRLATGILGWVISKRDDWYDERDQPRSPAKAPGPPSKRVT